MAKKKWRVRAGLLLFAAAAACSCPAAAMAGALKEAMQEQKELEDALQKAQELIDALKSSKQDVAKKVEELDARMTEISASISDLEAALEEKNAEISDAQERLGQAREEERRQYGRMKQRIQFLYESSRSSLIERVLSAESFAEALALAEYASQISQYDRAMLQKYRDAQEAVQLADEELKAGRARLEEMQAKAKEERQAVSALLSAKEEELARAEEGIRQADGQKEFYEAELAAQNEAIAWIIRAEEEKKAARKALEEAREAEEARKAKEREEAAQKAGEAGTQEIPEGEQEEAGEPEEPLETDAYDGGPFAWPCPSSRRITSEYGDRVSPTAGASSNHKGIDIGADYGADIVAAADGEVIFAGYSGSAGNYMMIDHGGSLYTVYMHASSLVAGRGDVVKKGQVIAKVGSTGISTGNHLHFGVSFNGSYVSPWNYLGR